MPMTLGDPATRAAAVTPSDSTIISARALYVGGAGNVAIIPVGGGSAITFTNVQGGSILPVSCEKVMATNTTATNIVALF